MRTCILPALPRVRRFDKAAGTAFRFWFMPSTVCPLLPARERMKAKREKVKAARSLPARMRLRRCAEAWGKPEGDFHQRMCWHLDQRTAHYHPLAER